MKHALAILTLLLAACGKSGTQQAAAGTNGDTATATAAAGGEGVLTIQPGEWETTMLMHMPDVPNLPRGVHLPPAQPITTRSCITAEQVARSNKAFLGGGTQHGVDCDYSGVTIGDGRIHGTSTCGRNGVQVTMTMDGSFTPTAYDINQQMTMTTRGRTSNSTGHMTGRRISECAPGGH